MTDRNKGKPPAPLVQVVRRPAGTTAPVPQPVVRPIPVARPVPVPVKPNVVKAEVVAPPSPSAPELAKQDVSKRTPTSRSFGRPSTPRPPPTPEAINALAKSERVPARIAKGELEGKMKCRIWKKLHREEAGRFDQAYTLMGVHPNLELAEAFGVVQSGLSVDEFLARRARVKRKEEVKEARATVSPVAIDAFIEKLKTEKTETAFVLGERTASDVIKDVQPISFELEKGGRLEKLQVVILTTKSLWDTLGPKLPRDTKLSSKPVPVARQPARRPVHDPRPFEPHVGRTLTIQLRNGITLTQPLLAIGPFDLLMGEAGSELFVPLHAVLSWSST